MSKPKFIKRGDGAERVIVRIELCIDKNTWQMIEDIAEAEGVTPREWLSSRAHDWEFRLAELHAEAIEEKEFEARMNAPHAPKSTEAQ